MTLIADKNLHIEKLVRFFYKPALISKFVFEFLQNTASKFRLASWETNFLKSPN